MQIPALPVDEQQRLFSLQKLENTVTELEQLALVAKHTHNAVIITDKDGFTTWVNEAFTKISGYSPAEIIGKRPGRVLQGKGTDRNVVYRISELVKKGLSFDEDIINYHKNGTAYWISLSVEPVFDAQGQLSQFIAIETDITLQKKLEEELKNAHSLMESAARIAGVGAWQVDLINNEVFWSDQTKKIHEVAPDFLPTMETAVNFYLPEVHEQLKSLIQHAIETKKIMGV